MKTVAPVQQTQPSPEPGSPLSPDGQTVLRVLAPRPGWKLRARLRSVGILCGRVPAGFARTAAEAVAFWNDRHPEVAMNPAVVEARAVPVREGP